MFFHILSTLCLFCDAFGGCVYVSSGITVNSHASGHGAGHMFFYFHDESTLMDYVISSFSVSETCILICVMASVQADVLVNSTLHQSTENRV